MMEAMQIIERLYKQGKMSLQEKNALMESYKDSKVKAKTKKKEAKKNEGN